MGCKPSHQRDGEASSQQGLQGSATTDHLLYQGGPRLKFEDNQQVNDNAEIVLSWPFKEESEEEISQEDMKLEANRADLLERIIFAGMSYSAMKSADGDEVFIIVQATEERLMEQAEASEHEMRLKQSWQVPYAKFTKRRQDDFVWEDREKGIVFSTRDRQTLIMAILEHGHFDSKQDMKCNPIAAKRWKDHYGSDMHATCGLTLDSYRADGTITGYWAMHGKWRRQKLLDEWAYKFWTAQPLNLIFEYFNSKTAIYFAFMGYYTFWLVVASIFGGAVSMYDWFIASQGRGDDNKLIIAFTMFMALWGTLFLENWKRFSAELSYRWSTINLEAEEPERHEYKRHCTEKRKGFYSTSGHFVPYDEDLGPARSCTDSCTGGYWALDAETHRDTDVSPELQDEITKFAPPEESFMSERTRNIRSSINCTLATFFIATVVAALFGFLIMRLVFQNLIDANYGAILASTTQAIVTVVLNLVYQQVAIKMVEYENYRTATEWENAISWKVFAFQFINTYFTLFYIAFLKGRTGDLDGYSDKCKDANGKETESCMHELSTLLVSTLLTTEIAMTIAEAAVPYVKYRLLLLAEQAKWKAAGNEGPLNLTGVDHESKLQPADPLDAFFDYNKMALQFGFVSMFCAAFPLAPAAALCNNILEIRTDAGKRLLGMQRPAPSVRAENVGAWMQIFELISLIAVGTNIGVLCFTSDRLAKLMNLDSSQQVWAFVIIEHCVLFFKMIMGFAIADAPEWVALRSDRDAYMLVARDEIIWREDQKHREKKNTLVSVGSLAIKKADSGTASSSSEFAHVGSGTGAAPASAQGYGTLSIL